MAVGVPAELSWDSNYLSALMRRKKIHDRRDLAQLIGIPYTTICAYVTDDWNGSVHLPTLNAIARTFNVHAGRLIADTRLESKK